ncbi:39S ribosomal protein L18 [Pyrus ussuriensis x Pyrus communis]|uniref:39S ribosomal protein L18 n=1 Tax=Pyrus ussuriensis x Pyrus communis TaxID=2448454 RepID=A0A5N5HB91_9ROSA|nr:39S ribosomal protein L18 [Pyrus ussuriensis x Pyrus communis]
MNNGEVCSSLIVPCHCCVTIAPPWMWVQSRLDSFIQVAWTQRSRGKAANRPNKKSRSQMTYMYMRPLLLAVFFSKQFIHAKVMQRGINKMISVTSTNSRDLRYLLPSLTDDEACRVEGNLIGERFKNTDVFAMSFEPKKSKKGSSHS